MAGVSSPLARIERNPRDRSLAARRREVGREEEEEGGGGGRGSHGGYNIISRVGVVKKGGGAADPRSILLSLSLFRSIFPLPSASALPRRAAQASNSDRVQDDRPGK